MDFACQRLGGIFDWRASNQSKVEKLSGVKWENFSTLLSGYFRKGGFVKDGEVCNIHAIAITMPEEILGVAKLIHGCQKTDAMIYFKLFLVIKITILLYHKSMV